MMAGGKRGLAALCAAGVACFATLAVPARSAWAGEVLITEAEAKLPPQKGAIAAAARGITRGPRVELIETAKDGTVHSPIHFQLRFQSFGGAKVDTSALQITYLKTPAVDLTSRVKPFVKETGVDMPDAVLPPGEHPLRVDIKDSEGRMATTNFVLKVAQ